MADKSKLDKIKEILKDEYEGKMSEATIDAFAKDLHYSLLEKQYDLEDIPAIITEYETDEDIEGDWIYIFCQLIDLLDNGPTTARRLYKSFMHEFDILETCAKLINENSRYLSEEELEVVKAKAFFTFTREALEGYGIIKP